MKASAPKELASIAHYAVCWGSSDDGYRSDLIERASDEAVENLRYVVALYEHELDQWLAGPEAAGREFSDAYIAYGAMRMASDGA